jgi:hypothetical protein
VREDGVYQSLADTHPLAFGRDPVGREKPEAAAVLRDCEADNVVPICRHPAPVRIDREKVPHPLNPLLGAVGGAWLYLRVADLPAYLVRFEKQAG